MAAVSSSGEKALDRVAIASVLVVTLLFLAPIYWIASTAFKSQSVATSVPPTVIFEPELTSFAKLFTRRVQLKGPVDRPSTRRRLGGRSSSTIPGSACSRTARARRSSPAIRAAS